MIRLGSIAGTSIKMHPAFPVMAAVFLLLGKGNLFFSSLLALFLHETGHLLGAKAAKIRLSELEIMPMGGVLRMDAPTHAPCQECLVSLAGPFFNVLCALLLYAFSDARALQLFRANLVLFFGNLLPVLPLDGGRALRALLSQKLNPAGINRTLSFMGCLLGISAALLGVFSAVEGRMNPMLFLWGAYLVYAALRERETLAQACIAALHERKRKMKKESVLNVHWMAVHQDTPDSVLAGKLSTGAYCAFILLDDDMKKQGVKEENEILSSVFQAKTSKTSIGQKDGKR